MKTVSVFLEGKLVADYPIVKEGELVGGPLTTDEEYAAAARACVVEDGLVSAEDAQRADYMVDGEYVDLPNES